MSYEDTGIGREERAINDEIEEENEEKYFRYDLEEEDLSYWKKDLKKKLEED